MKARIVKLFVSGTSSGSMYKIHVVKSQWRESNHNAMKLASLDPRNAHVFNV